MSIIIRNLNDTDIEPSDELPWICPEHPHAAVLHVWDEEHFVIGGLPAGSGIRKNERYVCPVCMRELAPPEEGPNVK